MRHELQAHAATDPATCGVSGSLGNAGAWTKTLPPIQWSPPIDLPEVIDLGEEGWARWRAAVQAAAFFDQRSPQAERIRQSLPAQKAVAPFHRRRDD